MPSLPFELERLIFEIAALQEADHDSRVRLTLVSKRVCEWIRPILYRIAIIQKSVESERTSVSWRKAGITDIAPYVRHFLLFNIESGVFDMISTFRNLEDLAIWHGDFVPEDLQKLNDLPLRMFSVDLSSIDLDVAAKNYQAFKNLTHLEIIGLKGSIWDDCKALTELPKLTHLCFYVTVVVEEEVLHGLLRHCVSLQALFFLSDIQGTAAESFVEVDDPRYLALYDDIRIEDSIAEWERSANGRIGIWELADVIIEARKGKLFKDDTSVIFSRAAWMFSLNDDGMRWYHEWSRDCRNVYPS